jgi:hypothetical protein
VTRPTDEIVPVDDDMKGHDLYAFVSWVHRFLNSVTYFQ